MLISELWLSIKWLAAESGKLAVLSHSLLRSSVGFWNDNKFGDAQ